MPVDDFSRATSRVGLDRRAGTRGDEVAKGTGRAPRRASHAETYPLPQPSSTAALVVAESVTVANTT
jgi:hypothetical protein